MQRESFKHILCEKTLWLLILIGVIYFYRPLFLHETFFFRDLYLDVFPQKTLLADFLQARELPLWNPYYHGGQPYLADWAYFPLHPSNLLYAICSPLTAFNLTIVVHIVGGTAAAYLLARGLGLRALSSFIVGIIYGFCGYTLSLLNLAGRGIVIPYIPLLVLFWHLYLLERRRRWFVMASLSGALQVLAGAPEINLISLIVLFGWTLCFPYPRLSWGQRCGRFILLWGFIVGMTFIQVLPAVEMASQSVRTKGLTYGDVGIASLSPGRILEMVLPGLLGYVDKLPWAEQYWGGKLVDHWNPIMLSIYFGGLALSFGVMGGLSRLPSPVLPIRLRRYLLALFGSGLLLSFGRFLPFFKFLFEHVPLISIFRYPIKFLSAGILPLALLAGYTSEIHFAVAHSGDGESRQPAEGVRARTPWRPSWAFLGIFWGIAGILGMLTGAFWLSKGMGNRLIELFFHYSGSTVAYQGIQASLTHATALWMVVALLYLYRRLTPNKWQHVLLAWVVVVDLLPAGSRINFYAPSGIFTNTPPLAQFVREQIGDGRLFPTTEPENTILRIPSENRFDLPRDSCVWGVRWNLETLFSYTGAFYRIPVIFHDPMALGGHRLQTLKLRLASVPWEERLPILSAGAVRLIISPENVTVAGMRLLGEIPNWSETRLYLYQNDRAARRTEFVTHWAWARTDPEALDAMLRPGYDPRQQVVLQRPEASVFDHVETHTVHSLDKPLQACEHPQSDIRTITANTHSASLSVKTNCDGYLVFSEAFYPGWHATVDGQPTPLWRANYAFSAIFLSAGEHEVQRYYYPYSLLIGAGLSLACCGMLAVVVYKGWGI